MDPNFIEFAEVDDIWIRSYSLEKAGRIASQHVHAHDHITLVSSGTVQAWQNEECIGVFSAPSVITVLANKKHAFVALTDNVVLCCLHNLRGTGLESPEIIKGV